MEWGLPLWASAAEECGRTQRKVCQCPLQEAFCNTFMTFMKTPKLLFRFYIWFFFCSLNLSNHLILCYLIRLTSNYNEQKHTVDAFSDRVDDGEVITGASTNQ